MKRLMTVVLSMIILIGLSCGAKFTSYNQVEAKNFETLELGDYFTLGKYNNEPILWRYMADDEKGKLIVSDKIICLKPFGTDNYWKNSFIRKWLNSDSAEGLIDWSLYVPEWIIPEININERGFLHDSNFSYTEKSIIRAITQWTMLPENKLDLTENGEKSSYSNVKTHTFSNPPEIEIYSISEIPEIYFGAAHQLVDTVFLLDERQIYSIWSNFDTLLAMNTKENLCGYSLRTPTELSVCGINANMYSSYTIYNTDKAVGIRPAFYLEEENAYIKSGSGTVDDPYIMDGIEKAVYINNVKAEMKEPPVTVEGIVMVPMKETFEKLGANVIYDEETQAVTAELNGKYIYTLTDNKGILINGECDDMGYPMTMILGKPYVPLSAIEKSVTTNVQWNNDLQQLNIWTE